ncbi:MAG: hypothetical protein M3141_08655 [Actinomycetota bacterium]|nr:hypothetical protein [Actinomycetota bacterium]
MAGLAGAALLVAATFATIIEIEVVTTREVAANVDTQLSGEERHGVALIVIAAAAVLMLLGALRGAKPAMLALAALGITALIITVGGDAPDLDDTGLIGELYDSASAGPGTGFYLETLGAALLLVAGGGLLVLGSGEREGKPSTSES